MAVLDCGALKASGQFRNGRTAPVQAAMIRTYTRTDRHYRATIEFRVPFPLYTQVSEPQPRPPIS